MLEEALPVFKPNRLKHQNVNMKHYMLTLYGLEGRFTERV
jgi:hypothetical protein